MSDPKLPQGSRRCKCPTCREYFNSESAFDAHRRGAYPARRCMAADEMAAAGLLRNSGGYWITRAREGTAYA